MVGLRAGAALSGGIFAAAVFSGCFDAPTAIACNPGTFDTTSTSGDTLTMSTGLRFLDSANGSGGLIPWCANVVVHYEGFLTDGTKFDSSRDIDRPLAFVPGMGVLIDGFEQGVIGMQVDGIRRLIIPPELGYGSEPVRDNTGATVIPANSTLIFVVEVVGAANPI
jgi:peptidylprolyl isomerase